MARRTILVLGSAAILLGALGCARYRKEPVAAEGDLSPRPEVVTTILAREEQWHSTLRAIGTVAAVQGVMVSADAPGVVARIGFESGVAVRKGDVLVELDARQERAQLAAAQADRAFVSPATLSVRVQASFANPGRAMSPGMLVKTEVSLDAERAAVALPRSAINYAQDGDSVFVVATLRRRDGTSYRGVRQKFVEVGE